MDILIGWQSKTYEFVGEEISVELRPLKVDAMLGLIPFIKDTEEESVSLIADSLELQKQSKLIFPEHVRTLKGLTINGEDVKDISVLCDEMIFSTLVVQILGDLIRMSTLTEGEEENLDEPVILLKQPQVK